LYPKGKARPIGAGFCIERICRGNATEVGKQVGEEPATPLAVRRSSVRLRQRILRIMTRSLLGSVTGRSAFTWSAVTDAAPLPQAARTKVNTWAISSLVSCTRYGGMR